MGSFIVSKLKEASTWSGLAAVIAGMTFIPHAADIAQMIPAIGVVIGGMVSIYLPN